MTIREILSIGHPTLRAPADPIPIEEITSPEIQQLVDDLIETMRHANGAGLAANQIGVTKRVVAIEVNDNPRYPYKPRIPLTVAVNPVLTPLDDEMVTINEGCLSVPLRGFVERHVNLGVSYHDRHGEQHRITARGLTAGTWQHECDHLDGVLIVDRADPRTLATWGEYERHYRDDFVARISDFVARVGS
jgi:peptide deformylase